MTGRTKNLIFLICVLIAVTLASKYFLWLLTIDDEEIERRWK